MKKIKNEKGAHQHLRWVSLDNAAKIYPAAKRRDWVNVFRVSATLVDDVDRAVLQSALERTVPRFPTIAARLRRGVFWYYIEEVSHAPEIIDEREYPLVRMNRRELGTCSFRVVIYGKRIALEVFHGLTDGTGAMIFLKTLVAEYVEQRYGVKVPAECGILSRDEEASPEELEDSFPKNAGGVKASRKESDAWRIYGEREVGQFLNLTCFKLPIEKVLEMSHGYGVTATVFISALVAKAILELQKERVKNPKRRKAVKILIPINLRRLYGSRTLRNFAMYSIPKLDPRLGEYSFEEICSIINHRLALDNTAKSMSKMIETNVASERMLILRVMPLWVKNIAMKAVFDAVGEKKSCLSVSNLGLIKLPDVMTPYVARFDFILGVQATAPYNCGVVSYGDTVYINFIRNIKEPLIERALQKVMRDMDIIATVESNRGDMPIKKLK